MTTGEKGKKESSDFSLSEKIGALKSWRDKDRREFILHPEGHRILLRLYELSLHCEPDR
jgi:hypothetical protein